MSLKMAPQLPLYVERLVQLDAQHLDDTFMDMIQEQAKAVFRFASPTAGTDNALEIGTALRGAVFGFTVASDVPSLGAELMGLQYRNEGAATGSRAMDALSAKQKTLLGAATVLLPYLTSRVEAEAVEHQWSTLGDHSWRLRLLRMMRRLGKLWTVLSTLHLLHFCLMDGKYRSVAERLVGARLVPQHRLGGRGSMPFDFLSQQLVFSGIAEFCRWVVPVWGWWRDQLVSTAGRLNAWSEGNGPVVDSTDAESIAWEHHCSICEISPPGIPFRASCGHVGCYVCLQAVVMQDAHSKCSRCNSAVSPISRKK